MGHPTSAHKDLDSVIPVEDEEPTSRPISGVFKQNGGHLERTTNPRSKRRVSFTEAPAKAVRRISQLLAGNQERTDPKERTEPNPFSIFKLSPDWARSQKPAITPSASKMGEVFSRGGGKEEKKDKSRFDGPPKVEFGIFYKVRRDEKGNDNSGDTYAGRFSIV